MKRSFSLGRSNEVIKDGQIHDLHNDFLTTAITFDSRENELRVLFKRTSDGKSFALEFAEIDILEFSGNLGNRGVSGLDEMGYKDVNDYDYEWLSDEAQSTLSDHLVIRFDGGATLRVHGASADFFEDKTLKALERRHL